MSDSLRPHGLYIYSPWISPGQNTGVGSLFLLQGIVPTQDSNPGLPHCRWILYQLSHKGNPRILEWVAIPPPVDLPNPGIKLGSPALQADSLPTEISGKPPYQTQGLFSKREKLIIFKEKELIKKQKTLIIILTETKRTLHL